MSSDARTPALPELARDPGLVRSAIRFASDRRRWWLLPVVVGLLVAGAVHAINTLMPGGAFVYPLL